MSVSDNQQELEQWASIMALLAELEGLSEQGEWQEVNAAAARLDAQFRAFFAEYSPLDESLAQELAKDRDRIVHVLTSASREAKIQRDSIVKEATGISKGQKVVNAYKRV